MLGMGLPLFPDKLCIAVCGRAGASKFLEVLFFTLAAHLLCTTLHSVSQMSLASSHASGIKASVWQKFSCAALHDCQPTC